MLARSSLMLAGKYDNKSTPSANRPILGPLVISLDCILRGLAYSRIVAFAIMSYYDLRGNFQIIPLDFEHIGLELSP